MHVDNTLRRREVESEEDNVLSGATNGAHIR